MEDSTTRLHESDYHHGITYRSVQGGNHIVITNAQSNQILMETLGKQVLFNDYELEIHDLAEIATIASNLTKER